MEASMPVSLGYYSRSGAALVLNFQVNILDMLYETKGSEIYYVLLSNRIDVCGFSQTSSNTSASRFICCVWWSTICVRDCSSTCKASLQPVWTLQEYNPRHEIHEIHEILHRNWYSSDFTHLSFYAEFVCLWKKILHAWHSAIVFCSTCQALHDYSLMNFINHFHVLQWSCLLYIKAQKIETLSKFSQGM